MGYGNGSSVGNEVAVWPWLIGYGRCDEQISDIQRNADLVEQEAGGCACRVLAKTQLAAFVCPTVHDSMVGVWRIFVGRDLASYIDLCLPYVMGRIDVRS